MQEGRPAGARGPADADDLSTSRTTSPSS